MQSAHSHEVHVVAHEYGDSGVLFDFVAESYEQRWSVTQAVGAALRAAPPQGFVDLVASYENLFVSFDPRRTSHEAIVTAIESLASHDPASSASRVFEIGVVYGGEFGPDIDAVAQVCELNSADVIGLHSAAPWTIRFVASPIGAPLMDGSALPVSVPRLATPRSRVEPGSVAVSGKQCVIYNAPSPGGWQIVGRTPTLMFDLATPPHVLYRAGDQLRLIPIEAGEWEAWRIPPRLVTQ